MQPLFIPLDIDPHPPRGALTGRAAPSLSGVLGAPINIEVAFFTGTGSGATAEALATSSTGKLTLKKKNDRDGDALFTDLTMVESGTGEDTRYTFEGLLTTDELLAAIGGHEASIALSGSVAWTEPGEDEDRCIDFDFTLYNSSIRDLDTIPATTDARWAWLKAAAPEDQGFTHHEDTKTIEAEGGGGGTPSAHASTHASAGSDPLTLAQSQITGLTTALGNKASTTHASTHAAAGSDPITLAQSQVTNLTTNLSDISTALALLDTLKAPLGSIIVHASDGSQTKYATLALAKAAANSGETIYVGPGSYTVTATLLKNGVNWFFDSGATITSTSASILSDAGSAVTCEIKGGGVFVQSGTVSCVKVSHASSVVRLTCDRISLSASGGGSMACIEQSAGRLHVRARHLRADSNSASLAYTACVWWLNGPMHVDCDLMEFDIYGVWQDCSATPTGEGFVHCDHFLGFSGAQAAANCTAYGNTGTNTSAAMWIFGGVIRPIVGGRAVSNYGASKMYVEAQKIYGAMQTGAFTGLTYIRTIKHEVLAAAETLNGGIGLGGNYMQGGEMWVDVQDIAHGSIVSPWFNVTSGTLHLSNARWTSPASIADVGTGFTITVAGASVPPTGTYFTITNGGTTYDVWIDLDGNGWDGLGGPYAGSNTGLAVTVTTGDINETIAAAVSAVLNAVATCTANANIITGTVVPTSGPTDVSTGFTCAAVNYHYGISLVKQSGGTVDVLHCTADTTAATSASDYGLSVTGGTMTVRDSRIVAHATGKDIVRTGGTVTVSGGYGSGLGNSFRTSGTVTAPMMLVPSAAGSAVEAFHNNASLGFLHLFTTAP